LVRGGHAVLQSLAQANGVGEHGEADVVDAGAMQSEPPAIKQAPHQVLLQVYLLDGAQLQLVRRAPNQPALENEPLIGDADLGAPKRQQDSREQADAKEQEPEPDFDLA